MADKPLVSILIPVYGVEKYIERCARSVFEQTYENLDIVFVDDCTPDNSITILKRVIIEYPQRSNQIRIIPHKQNCGIAATRNTLVAAAKGEFIVHVDSDDWMELDAVELLIRRQQETNADIVTAKAYWYQKDKIVDYADGGMSDNKEEVIKGLLELRFSHTLWRRLIRASLYREHSITYCEGVNIDEDLQVVIPLFYFSNSVSYVDAYTYHYWNVDDTSLTLSYLNDYNLQDMSEKSVKMIIDFLKNKNHEYYTYACNSLMWKKQVFLFRAAEKSDKKRYNEIADGIYSLREYWGAIRWDFAPIRWIERSYYRYKVFEPIIKLYRLLRKNI